MTKKLQIKNMANRLIFIILIHNVIIFGFVTAYRSNTRYDYSGLYKYLHLICLFFDKFHNLQLLEQIKFNSYYFIHFRAKTRKKISIETTNR